MKRKNPPDGKHTKISNPSLKLSNIPVPNRQKRNAARRSAGRQFFAFYADFVFSTTIFPFGRVTKNPSRLRNRKNSSPYSRLSVVASNRLSSIPLRFPCCMRFGFIKIAKISFAPMSAICGRIETS